MNVGIAPRLILASGSPRRSALLRQLGVPHRIRSSSIEERRERGEAVATCVCRLAGAKAQQVWEDEDEQSGEAAGDTRRVLPVLGADTAVVVDGQMLGKPRHREDALSMLEQLSGRTHQVLTAVALRAGGGLEVRLSQSEVQFRAIAASEGAAYWDTGEPCDKAGGYAIQGYAAAFVQELRGSYSGVMGLPLFETSALLDAAGVARWRSVAQDA